MMKKFTKKAIWFSLAALLSMPAAAVEYSPNFKETDIKEFINVVGKDLHKTVIINPNVRGKINVRSYEVLNEDQYYQFFLNVLEVYGYSIVEMDNGILKVVRNKDAKTAAIPVVGDKNPGQGDEMVTRVVQVKNVSVRELAPLLRQFSDQAGSGHVVNYDPSNVIMMTGSAATVNRLVEIIHRVDRAGDQEVHIVKLEHASSAEMVRILSSIYKDKGGKSTQPAFLIPKIVADERTNSIIVSGEPQARDKAIGLIQRLDSELESNGNTKVFYIKYAKAEDLVKVLKGVSESIKAEEKQGQQKARRTSNRDVSIEAHPESNALVITAEPDMMRSLQAVISQLDIRRAQVLVEAIIVEVFDGAGINLSVQLMHESGGIMQFANGSSVPITGVAAGALAARGQKGTTTTTVVDGNTVTTTTPDELGDFSALGQALSGVNGFMVGGVSGGWGAVLQAVSTDTNSNILSTPYITTLDNQEASFIVGQEVPTITGTTTGANNSNPFQTVDRKEIGIKLKVTPQINEGNSVKLNIEQEVSSLSGATSVDITINKRELKTTIMADDGGIVVLGGLIDNDIQESVSRVPLLGDIPIIGHLFKSTSTTSRKRNLLVFIRPTIIRDDAVMQSISRSKYNYIRGQQEILADDGIELMPFEETPVFPQWDEDLALPPTFDDYLNNQKTKDDNDE